MFNKKINKICKLLALSIGVLSIIPQSINAETTPTEVIASHNQNDFFVKLQTNKESFKAFSNNIDVTVKIKNIL